MRSRFVLRIGFPLCTEKICAKMFAQGGIQCYFCGMEEGESLMDC